MAIRGTPEWPAGLLFRSHWAACCWPPSIWSPSGCFGGRVDHSARSGIEHRTPDGVVDGVDLGDRTVWCQRIVAMKIVLTGVTRGLGRALVRHLLAKGRRALSAAVAEEEPIFDLRLSYSAPHEFSVVDVAQDVKVSIWAAGILAWMAHPISADQQRCDYEHAGAALGAGRCFVHPPR